MGYTSGSKSCTITRQSKKRMKGVKHYKRDGTEHKGGSHKMPNGDLQSGKSLTGKTSVKLFHFKDLSKKAKAKAKPKGKKVMAETKKKTHKTKDGRTAKKGLYYNINKKRAEGKKMRKKGAKGAPTAAAFKRSAKTAKEPKKKK
jgi:hypothetical protein